MGNILKHHGFARPWRRDDQAALAFALRTDQINDTGRHVFIVQLIFHSDLFVRMQRGQVIEINPVSDVFGIREIDFENFCQCEIFFTVLWGADFAFDRIAGAQAEFFDLAG